LLQSKPCFHGAMVSEDVGLYHLTGSGGPNNFQWGFSNGAAVNFVDPVSTDEVLVRRLFPRTLRIRIRRYSMGLLFSRSTGLTHSFPRFRNGLRQPRVSVAQGPASKKTGLEKFLLVVVSGLAAQRLSRFKATKSATRVTAASWFLRIPSHIQSRLRTTSSFGII
jgi:hypothetical protein